MKRELLIREVENGIAVYDLNLSNPQFVRNSFGDAPRWVFTNPVSLADFLRAHFAAEITAEKPEGR